MIQKKERPSIPGQGRRPSKKSCNKHLFVPVIISRSNELCKMKTLTAVYYIFTATMLQKVEKEYNILEQKDIFCSTSLLQGRCNTATHAEGGHCYVY